MKWLKWVAVALLLATGVLGIKDGVSDWNNPVTALQRTVTLGVLVYGVLGIVGAIALIRQRRWSVAVSAVWGVVLTYVASVASFAFSDPSLSQQGTLGGVLGAFLATALIGALVVWIAHRSTRAAAASPKPTQIG